MSEREVVLTVIRDVEGVRRLRVGRGSISQAKYFASLWERHGWNALMEAPLGRREPFVSPYDPVVCDQCSWAGMNLSAHYRMHSGKPPAGWARLAKPAQRQTRAAAQAGRLPAKPSPGMLIVRVYGDIDARPWRLLRYVDNHFVAQSCVSGTVVNLTEEEILDKFQPVASWRGR